MALLNNQTETSLHRTGWPIDASGAGALIGEHGGDQPQDLRSLADQVSRHAGQLDIRQAELGQAAADQCRSPARERLKVEGQVPGDDSLARLGDVLSKIAGRHRPPRPSWHLRPRRRALGQRPSRMATAAQIPGWGARPKSWPRINTACVDAVSRSHCPAITPSPGSMSGLIGAN